LTCIPNSRILLFIDLKNNLIMKKLAFLIPIIAFAVSACQQTAEPVDIEAEKEAIMKVIQNESEFARDGKFEEFVDLYIHDEFNTRLNFGMDSYEIINGWDNIKVSIESIKDRDSTTYQSINVSKENPTIKITGKNAWLICDNIWQGTYEGEEVYSDGIQITFLEKVDGEWKISFAGWLQKPQLDDDEDEDEVDEQE